MKIEEERKVFLEWYNEDKFDEYQSIESIAFEAWLASANREGYKLVPVEKENFNSFTGLNLRPNY